MKRITVFFLALILSGCASQSSPTEPMAVSVAGETIEQNAVICKMEKPTGSNRPVKVCRPAPGALDEEQTKRDMRVLQRQSELLNK
jgi:PBP1b-binding outer membrane lipoprotein LpoB